jgi:DNA polymerase-3 subunit gamma/tau
MLGLMDRARIIDLFEAVMAGDTASAIREIEAQYEVGGDPKTILNDIADYVHWVTRLKVVKEPALSDTSRTEAEKTRGVEHAARIGMAHLTRAWSMLLKGIREVELHASPLLAAEMVLIRLAHGADLPGTEELARLAKQESPGRVASPPSGPAFRRDGLPTETNGALAVQSSPAVSSPPQPASETRAIANFSDILALAAQKRDIKLKTDLERLVRPIRVSPGQFELALEASAPPGLANEISRKLEAWTGIRWMVLVAKDGGAKPVAAQARESRDSAFRAAREHPDVLAVLKRFPGAEIVDVRQPETSPPQPMSETDEESR